jgi:hypothetical protein
MPKTAFKFLFMGISFLFGLRCVQNLIRNPLYTGFNEAFVTLIRCCLSVVQPVRGAADRRSRALRPQA